MSCKRGQQDVDNAGVAPPARGVQTLPTKARQGQMSSKNPIYHFKFREQQTTHLNIFHLYADTH